MGRPSKYQEQFPEQAAYLTKLGATDKDLAEFFKVSESTINLWKEEHPEFSESLKQGKEYADSLVVKSLYKRATGYEFEDIQFASFQGEIFSEKYTKHIPPDITAIIFWLKNRRPEEWRDKQEIDHTSKGKSITPNKTLTDDEIKVEIEKRGLPISIFDK